MSVGRGASALGSVADDLAAAALAMARRFDAGATLWCTAPEWPHHAQHVAVEFVHPVVVGKRALPAVVAPAGDCISALRPLVTAGDIILAVARGCDPDVRPLMQRARAWGATTVWIGSGDRPPAGAADHVLWVRGGGGVQHEAHRGDFVLLFHLLWELAHVCFEHGGFAPGDDDCAPMCITCSDAARLGEVIEVGPDDEVLLRTAVGEEAADATLVGPVAVGDLLLVHAGTAIERVATTGFGVVKDVTP